MARTRFHFFPFPWLIAACGVVILLGIAGNLAVLGLKRHPGKPRLYVSGSDPTRGAVAIERYGCGGCHVIPGIGSASGRVGPRLDGFAYQGYVGGVLPNTPDNLVSWIVDPQAWSPHSAMPKLGVSEAEARDIAAYLYRH